MRRKQCFSSASQCFINTEITSDYHLTQKPKYSHDVIEYDKVSIQKSVLAMDGPELVPFAKLEPIPELQSAPLPKFCRKIVMFFYTFMCLISITVVLYGSMTSMFSMDFGPWFEQVIVGFMLTLYVSEPLVLLMVSFVILVFDKVNQRNTEERLSMFCDFVYPTENVAMPNDQCTSRKSKVLFLIHTI